MRSTLIALLVCSATWLSASVVPAAAQTTAQSCDPDCLGTEEFRRQIRLALEDGELDDDELTTLWATKEELLFAAVLTGRIRELMRVRRTDVQGGAGGSSSGTTTTVVNPLFPAAFGFSFENGAVTRSTSGTTATLNINPAGLVCATGANAGAVGTRDNGCGRYDFARRFAVSLGFDTGHRESKTPGVTPLGDQFASLAVRAEVINRRRPGTLGGFQAKLELPTANAAVRIPILFTSASRTELIKESGVRAQFGLSLNADSLFVPAP